MSRKLGVPCECGAAWPGTRICHCIGCHRTFTGERPFDAHRLGNHGVDRRCATEAEMSIKGLRERAGRWYRPVGAKRTITEESTNECLAAA